MNARLGQPERGGSVPQPKATRDWAAGFCVRATAETRSAKNVLVVYLVRTITHRLLVFLRLTAEHIHYRLSESPAASGATLARPVAFRRGQLGRGFNMIELKLWLITGLSSCYPIDTLLLDVCAPAAL